MASKRLPGKILLKFFELPVILKIVNNINKSKFAHKLIVATTKNKIDNKLVNVLKKNNINFFRGPSQNLVKRFFLCAKKYKEKTNTKEFIIVRICADTIFVNSEMVKRSLQLLKREIDLVTYSKKMLNGFNSDCLWFSTLKKLNKVVKKKDEQEHLNLHILRNVKKYKIKFLNYFPKKFKFNNNKVWITLDSKENFKFIKKIEKMMIRKNIKNLSYIGMINFLNKHAQALKIN